MSLEEILHAADERLGRINRDSSISTGELRDANFDAWEKLVQTARSVLPPAIARFVRADQRTHRDDFPTGISLSIDLPGAERIHFGPWGYDPTANEFNILDPWKNKPFEVAGGNREQFGDLLDAIARAREIFCGRYARD